MRGGFELARELPQMGGDDSGDAGGNQLGVERAGIGPDQAQAVADGLVRQIGDGDPV